jgi:ATP-dependent Clp protease protease subunit
MKNRSKDEEETCHTETVSIDIEAREILVFGMIDTDVAAKVFAGLRLLEKENRKDITLFLNSGGGEEVAGWVIYDALRLCKSNIVCQGYGSCMSMAALILQGCDKRLLAPHCRFMVHNGSITLGTQPLEKARAMLQEENCTTTMYYEKLAERSNLTVDEIMTLCNNETYMSAQQAVGYGFADGILK